MASLARKPPFYGWRVLGAAMALTALGGGLFSYGFSVFFLPIRESLGISAASASLIFALSRAEGAIEGPLAGYLIDRFGARIMLAIGALFMAGGFILLSTADSYLAVLLIYLFVISVGVNCGFGHASLALVNAWFSRRRGFAMAVASAAPALGGAVVAPALGVAVGELGWRTAAGLSGVLVVLMTIPVFMVVRRSPESVGLLPDGDEPGNARGLQSNTGSFIEPRDYSVREAIRTRTFWLLLAGTTLRICVGGALTVHFVAIMVWKGTDETVAAAMLGVFALISLPLRVLTGWIGDRYSRQLLLALTMAVGAAALTLLNYGSGEAALWLFLALFAFAESNPSLNWALVGDYFGRRQFATIRGAMSFFYGWANMAAPLFAGVIWDRTGSYELALWIFAVMWVAGAMIFALMRARKAIEPIEELRAVTQSAT
jgi:nitrate/nitrite transporter NarK